MLALPRTALTLLVLLCAISSSSSASTSLTVHTFEEETKGTNTFIKFFAPWCGHCQRLAPTWDKLADEVAADAQLAGSAKIAKVDCTIEHDLCNSYSVRGYPTLILLTKAGEKVPYPGGRELDALLAFVKERVAA